MKYVIAILFFALAPLVVQAASISDCEPNTLECLCPPALGVDDVPQSRFYVDDAETSCDVLCEELAKTTTGISNWQLQCVIDARKAAIAAGDLGDTESLIEEYHDRLGDTAPNLGVEIPGLEFSDSYERVSTIDGVEVKSTASNYIGEYIEAIYGWLLAAGALLAVVLFMVGGLEWMLSTGNATRIQKAKERISRAAIGLVILMSVYSIAYLIDPNTVTFDTLNIPIIEKIEFIPNETPFDFPKVGAKVLSSTDATQTGGGWGVGWNDWIIFDQTAFGSTPYGPVECMVPASSSSHGTGNIKSSGCGVASFTGVLHTYGYQVSISNVAQSFVDEGFRPLSKTTGCGHSGTYAEAFASSSLLDDAGLEGEWIVLSSNPPETLKQKVIQEIVDGNPIITSYVTERGNGHYSVIVGLDENDNFLINNPWGATMEKRTQDDMFGRMKTAVVIRRK